MWEKAKLSPICHSEFVKVFEPEEPIKRIEARADLFVGGGEINSESCYCFYAQSQKTWSFAVTNYWKVPQLSGQV